MTTGWSAILGSAIAMLVCIWSDGCVTHVHPIHVKTLIVPLEPLKPATQPATRPNIMPPPGTKAL